jgi:cytochrome c551
VALLVLTSCILLYTGCGRSQSVVQSDAHGPYAEAVHLYENGCITCHGDGLQGGIGPSLRHVGSRLTFSGYCSSH